jgi:transcription elongation factor GreB
MAPYITPEGELVLKDELHYLWKIERPIVTQSVSEAAAQGDRSENAEYTYGKKRLREIDRRVRYLRKRLDSLMVVRQLPTDQGKVWFGAWVELLDTQDQMLRYRLVGPDEINPASNYISIDSVLGRALLGKGLDSEVTIQTPSGTHTYVIRVIEYSSLPAGEP